MPIVKTEAGTTFTGNGINLYRMASLKSALYLELKGMKMSRGRSAFSIVKEEFQLKGNKQKVFDQFCELLEEAKAVYQND